MDAAVAPAMLRQQAEKIGATTVDIRASHVPMVSQPRAVADVIDQAARAAQISPVSPAATGR